MLNRLLFTYFALYLLLKVSFACSGYDLFSEEAQYWLWSKHLDWAYYSKPPFIAWLNFLVSRLFGDADYVIRLTALALGLGTLYAFYRLALLLFPNRRLAGIAVVLLSLTPNFLLASTFLTTDSPLLLFWVLSTYFLVQALQQGRWRDWIITGIFFGLGCLSKYAMVFFLLVLLSPFFWRPRKNLFPRVGLVCLIALLINLPVLWWNYQHDWVLIRHTGRVAGIYPRVLTWQRSLTNIGKLLGGILLMNSPFFVPFLLPLAHLYKNKGRGADKLKLSIALMPALGTGLFFLLFSIRKGVEVNWYSAGLVLLPLALAYAIERKQLFKQAMASISLSFLVTLLFLFPVLPDQAGMAGIIPLKADSMKRLAGWKELSAQVNELRLGMHRQDSSVLITDSYQIASELAFYTGDPHVVCINNGSRRMNQFDLWENRLARYKDKKYLAVYISENAPPANQFFSGQVLTRQEVPVVYRGREVRKFYILVVRDFKSIASPENKFSRF
jgi:hypothetical protein